MKIQIALLVVVLVASCARTQVVQTSSNEAIITTTAAPACGETGALEVANAMAAVTTLRMGFERFVVLGMGTDSNVQVTQMPSPYSYTTGQATVIGNTAYGSATTFRPSQTIISGRNKASMRVLMFRPDDDGYERGVDARMTLGEDWAEKVEEGVPIC